MYWIVGCIIFTFTHRGWSNKAYSVASMAFQEISRLLSSSLHFLWLIENFNGVDYIMLTSVDIGSTQQRSLFDGQIGGEAKEKTCRAPPTN